MKTLNQNLVFSFLTYVIILLFPPIYMVIEHSFMNKSYTAKIYIYIYIYLYIYIFIYLYIYIYIYIYIHIYNKYHMYTFYKQNPQ